VWWLRPPLPPRHAASELRGVIPDDPRRPFDIREIVARIVDEDRECFVPGTANVRSSSAAVPIVARAIDEHTGGLMRRSAEAVSIALGEVIARAIEQRPKAKEVAAALRELAARSPIVSCEIGEESDAARGGKSEAKSKAKTEARVLAHRDPRGVRPGPGRSQVPGGAGRRGAGRGLHRLRPT
jgi:hypothetical protein